MNDQNSLHFDRIAQAIEYIKDNFRAQPHLDEVAEKVHLSLTIFSACSGNGRG